MNLNYVCKKCQKSMDEGNFYTHHDGTKTDLCKKCLTMHIDNFDPNTFVWILKDMDVPYVPGEWNVLRDKAYAKDPKKMNGMSVLGKYLSKMKLKQFKDARWADSERLQREAAGLTDEGEVIDPEFEAEMKTKLDMGEISEAQYRTLVSTKTQYENYVPEFDDYAAAGPNAHNFYDESEFMREEDIPDPGESLTEDDKLYLAMKWGRLYKPSEWVELEKNYNDMVESFGIQDADTLKSLILLCKTYLKMNQSIDTGDMESYGKLSRVYDSLRKTMKLTAMQNKKDDSDIVDSIGEFIEMCEREEGFIPRFATDIPQDKVDLTLRDMNNYLYKLVTQDLGFGQQIEDSLKKIQIQKEMNAAAEDDGDPFAEPQVEELEDAEHEIFYEEINKQKENDLKMQEGE